MFAMNKLKLKMFSYQISEIVVCKCKCQFIVNNTRNEWHANYGNEI